MGAAFYCPNCDQPYALTDEQAPQYAGQRIACTNCGVAFTVPESVFLAGDANSPAAGTVVDPPSSGFASSSALAPQSQPQIMGQPPAYVAPPPAVRSGFAPAPVPPELMQPPQPAGGMAIGSLVTGILGFFIPLVPSLLAIGTGAVGVIRAKEGRAGGRGIAITGIVLGVVGLALHVAVLTLFVVPHFRQARSVAESERCAEHLRATGNALLAYASDNGGKFPDRIEQLASTRGFDSEQLYCPTATGGAGANRSYVYVGAGLTTSSKPECVLMYEPLDHHDWRGVNVLFVDGRVSFIGEIEAGKAIPRLKKGKNPPWTFTGN